MRVLIVDDHAAFRRAVGDVLREGLVGAVIAEAATADDAAHRVEGEPWDVVLLDLALGGRSGLETLRTVRRLRPDLAVVVTSMHPEAHYGPAARAAGATAYLAKGSPATAIVECVRRATGADPMLAPRDPPDLSPAAAAGPAPPRSVAQFLHDELGQELAAAKISLDLAVTAVRPEDVRRHATDASAVLARAIASLRRWEATARDTTPRPELPYPRGEDR